MNLRFFLTGKKRFFILFIAISILLTGGFFYYWFFYETPPEKWDEAEYSKPEDYVVKKTLEGTIVENKKAGISFRVPDGWRVEKERYRDYIALFSPDAEEISFIVKSGCKIKIEGRYIKTSFKTVEKVLKKGHENWGYVDEYKIINVDEYKALRNITGIMALDQYYIGVHVPIKTIFKNRIYSFGLNSSFQDKERCAREFDQFLKTVLIN